MAEKTKLKAGCGLVMVFGTGFLFGALVLFIIIVRVVPLSEDWRNEESKEFVMNHLANRLDLTEEQIPKIEPIVYEALDQRYDRRKTYLEADIGLTGKALSKMLPILSDKQKEKAEKVFENWKKGKERLTMPPDDADTRNS